MFELTLFTTIATLCNFGGGRVVETIKCQKYYVNCLREQVAAAKKPGYQEGMLEICVAQMILTPTQLPEKKKTGIEG
jgi:hypothetical protein